MSPAVLLVLYGYAVGFGLLLGALVALYNAWKS